MRESPSDGMTTFAVSNDFSGTVRWARHVDTMARSRVSHDLREVGWQKVEIRRKVDRQSTFLAVSRFMPEASEITSMHEVFVLFVPDLRVRVSDSGLERAARSRYWARSAAGKKFPHPGKLGGDN